MDYRQLFLSIFGLVTMAYSCHGLTCASCVDVKGNLKRGVSKNTFAPGLPQFPEMPSALCNDYPPSVFVECPMESAGCYTFTATVEGDTFDKIEAKVKTCGAYSGTSDLCDGMGKSVGASATCNVCTENKCNSGTSTVANLLLLALPALLYKILK